MRRTSTNNKRDVLHYDDVQPGDQFKIILTASMPQTVPGQYEFHGQSEVVRETPHGQKVQIQR